MEPVHQETLADQNFRLDQARAWLRSVGVEIQSGFRNVAGDASFRRYFRLNADGDTRILMDAPPPAEDTRPFIDVTQRLRTAGLQAPEVLKANTKLGFLLLEDLGDDLYREFLDTQNGKDHFPVLFEVLRKLASKVDAGGLPVYDKALLRTEMDLFPDWYLGCHRQSMPRKEFDVIWDRFCNQVIESALQQPCCFVHRDFHSANLLKAPGGSVGIIDYQDAVKGPVTYDFISLVWDRYVTWPRPQIEVWMEQYRQLLGVPVPPGQWRRYCDLMGVQRNIKVVGIFARLHYRDGKTGYLEMIPRFYEYVTDTLRCYPEFSEMLELLEQTECAP
ncbi:MAG: phosphotransferase [Xanthomonadales bacterium]|nr:phosphotransferase [Xanthomonadales bacterium]